MSRTSYTFHYITEEDRLALVFKKESEQLPTLLLTRRLTKLICEHLKSMLEQTIYQIEGAQHHKIELVKFEHRTAIESANIEWDDKPQRVRFNAESCVVPTKVTMQRTTACLNLLFFHNSAFIVKLSQGWQQVHCFFYALAEMSRKAQWDLETELSWAGRQSDMMAAANAHGYLQ